jgi:hypothetical protein
MLVALGGCGHADDDEIETETAAIQKRISVGMPVADALAAMREAGFACVPEQRATEQHFSCIHEQSVWLICTRRTRVILTQRDGKVSDVLVNVGRFCT